MALRLRVRGGQLVQGTINRLYCATTRVSLAHPVLFVAGLPKSGTTWVENFLGLVPGYVNRPLNGDRTVIREQNLPEGAFRWFPKHAGSVVKTHIYPTEANLEILDAAGIERILLMFRDPRDVAVSRYHHFARLGREKDEVDDLDYRNCSAAEGLIRSAERICESRLPWMEGWQRFKEEQDNRFHLVRYEALVKSPQQEFKKVAAFFELGLEDAAIDSMLQKLSWMRDQGIRTSEAIGKKSTFRSGTSGSWRSELPEEAVAVFRASSEAMERLGYPMN